MAGTCLCFSGLQDEVKITLDCSQADFIAYDKMVISLKGGEMWGLLTIQKWVWVTVGSLFLYWKLLVLQLCVDAHYRWHEKCAGFPLRQSRRQCLDDLCEYTAPCWCACMFILNILRGSQCCQQTRRFAHAYTLLSWQFWFFSRS